jgi:hypothetical protein
MHNTRVSPNAMHLVMALKRSIARVFFDPDAARATPRIRQDSAACVSLPSNSIVKEQSQRHVLTTQPDLTGSEDNEAPAGRTRAENHAVS